jgi:hypothetical protein
MSNSFSILSSYSTQEGVQASINNQTVQLTVSDICYLLIEVDGKATSNAASPPAHVKFSLHDINYDFTNEEWHSLQDELTSVVGKGGWTHTICS